MIITIPIMGHIASALITSVLPSPATLPSSNQPFLQPRPSCSLTDRTPTFLSNSTLHSKMPLALVSLGTSSSLALGSAASSGRSHESFCAFRCGSPACCDQPPVFPGQRGRCVRVGGWLHLDELQTAGHDRRGGHGSTSGGEWVDEFKRSWNISGAGKGICLFLTQFFFIVLTKIRTKRCFIPICIPSLSMNKGPGSPPVACKPWSTSSQVSDRTMLLPQPQPAVEAPASPCTPSGAARWI